MLWMRIEEKFSLVPMTEKNWEPVYSKRNGNILVTSRLGENEGDLEEFMLGS